MTRLNIKSRASGPNFPARWLYIEPKPWMDTLGYLNIEDLIGYIVSFPRKVS